MPEQADESSLPGTVPGTSPSRIIWEYMPPAFPRSALEEGMLKRKVLRIDAVSNSQPGTRHNMLFVAQKEDMARMTQEVMQDLRTDALGVMKDLHGDLYRRIFSSLGNMVQASTNQHVEHLQAAIVAKVAEQNAEAHTASMRRLSEELKKQIEESTKTTLDSLHGKCEVLKEQVDKELCKQGAQVCKDIKGNLKEECITALKDWAAENIEANKLRGDLERLKRHLDMASLPRLVKEFESLPDALKQFEAMPSKIAASLDAVDKRTVAEVKAGFFEVNRRITEHGAKTTATMAYETQSMFNDVNKLRLETQAQVDQLKQMFQAQGDQLRQTFVSFSDQAKNDIKSLQTSTAADIQQISEDTKEARVKVKDTLAEPCKRLQGEVQLMRDSVKELSDSVQGTLNTVGNMAKLVKDQVATLEPQMVIQYQEVQRTIVSRVQISMGEVQVPLKAFTDEVSQLKEKFNRTQTELVQVNQQHDKVEKSLSNIAKHIKDGADKVRNMPQEMEHHWTSLSEHFTLKVQGVVQTLKELLKDNSNSIRDVTSSIKDTNSVALTELRAEISSQVNKVETEVKETLLRMEKDLKSLSRHCDQQVTMATTPIKQIGSNLTDLQTKFQETADKMLQDIEKEMEKVVPHVNTALRKIPEQFKGDTQKISRMVKEMMSTMQGELAGVMSETKEGMEETTARMIIVVNNMQQQAAGLPESVKSHIDSLEKTIKNLLKESLKTVQQDVEGVFQALPEKLVGQLQKATDGLTADLKKVTDEVSKTVTEKLEGIVNTALGSFFRGAKPIGALLVTVVGTATAGGLATFLGSQPS